MPDRINFLVPDPRIVDPTLANPTRPTRQLGVQALADALTRADADDSAWLDVDSFSVPVAAPVLSSCTINAPRLTPNHQTAQYTFRYFTQRAPLSGSPTTVWQMVCAGSACQNMIPAGTPIWTPQSVAESRRVPDGCAVACRNLGSVNEAFYCNACAHACVWCGPCQSMHYPASRTIRPGGMVEQQSEFGGLMCGNLYGSALGLTGHHSSCAICEVNEVTPARPHLLSPIIWRECLADGCRNTAVVNGPARRCLNHIGRRGWFTCCRCNVSRWTAHHRPRTIQYAHRYDDALIVTTRLLCRDCAVQAATRTCASCEQAFAPWQEDGVVDGSPCCHTCHPRGAPHQHHWPAASQPCACGTPAPQMEPCVWCAAPAPPPYPAGPRYCEDCRQTQRQAANEAWTPQFSVRQLQRPKRTYARFGLELELELGFHAVHSMGAIQHAAASPCWSYHGDGSLNNGFELTTHPMTLEYYVEHAQLIGERLATMATMGMEARSTCGLHIHIDRRAFTPLTFLRFASLILNYPYFIFHLSRRTDEHWLNSYASLCEADSATARRKAATQKARWFREGRYGNLLTSRYVALNTEPARTVELRFFAATLVPAELRASIEFADALLTYARQTSARSITPRHFADYVALARRAYPALHDTLEKLPVVAFDPRRTYSVPDGPSDDDDGACQCSDCVNHRRSNDDDDEGYY